MEIDEVEDITDIYVVDVHEQGVVGRRCGRAIDDEMLVLVAYGEMTYIEVILSVVNIS